MTIDFTKKHLLFSFIAIIIGFLISVGSYFLFIKPEKELLSQKENQLNNVHQELAIVEEKLNNLKEKVVVSSAEIQKELPVKPLLEQLLLDIDRAELVSKSRVSQISVGSTSEEVPFPKEAEDDDENSLENEDNEKEDDKEKNDEYLPRGMKMVRVSIQAEADDYFSMEKFIEVLQTVQRIIRIDSINFSGQSEISSINDYITAIPFTISLTTFYFPNLTGLIEELPKLDLPPPADKRNPFVNFSDTDLDIIKKRQAEAERKKVQQLEKQHDGDNSEDDNERKQQDDINNENERKQQNGSNNNFITNNSSKGENKLQANENNNTNIPKQSQFITSHIVQPGDTLYQISMKYYGSRAGEQKIKTANNLASDVILVGQTLKIPR